VDPIQPIMPGPPPISQIDRSPVDPPPRMARERDRPSKDAKQRGRREPQEPEQEPEFERDPDDGEHPHIDVRA
jgi:hypothetical protein